MKNLYTAKSTSKGGRNGHVKSDDGIIDLDVTMPKSLGGDGATGTNPEQLFASGYSACFGSALGLVARKQNINPGPFNITGEVSLYATDGGGYKLGVKLVGAFPELDREKATALMAAAHQVCPYSNATRGNIEVELAVA